MTHGTLHSIVAFTSGFNRDRICTRLHPPKIPQVFQTAGISRSEDIVPEGTRVSGRMRSGLVLPMKVNFAGIIRERDVAPEVRSVAGYMS